MPIIDTIDEIQELLKEDIQYIIKLGLTGFPAAGKYPKAKVLVDNVELWAGVVSDTKLSFEVNILDDYLNIKICYFDKTDNDTIILDGEIVENQYIGIDYLECNNVLISGYDINDISLTNYNLSDSQKQAHIDNGFSWTNVKTNSLYNNGVWEANLKKPILTNLMKQKQKAHHIFDTSYSDVLLTLQHYFKG